ncbi:5-bromo-4-chloroindolyl phosphate hydrolysis family protein [Anaerococcus vaginalis]|uniref:5-bromo-4-chloroindolyl phosphate hydrolysis family protein n=1 Tax=Anaerococcus vaginalis TaxID=33037 RepID=UPI0029091800|nr:5-bromo-4-chloroindolyl phosphate hydrolysis family protein [Anaerococcus vaginalis]MDU4446659.1 5-bromo-4-chloroindolyl phosphate hydrolysis family protein [Anaerococcus vaginalis]MDU5252758.1 5-bromo-4-chloroindolyl phosphate hydrolysis family protein [Anaerococcus vaginalis]MDU6782284.1 5-bromo-4-chloroindolyl phosphate hydrolysis family protein [Anaerococcus vaginalis]MDU7433260.1 5-bromo-4-chloroindolyl phosphate hydrolysis family protein [Anaerococcus vaginalis]
MTNYDKENEKSLENSLNKAISDMDFSDISEKVKTSLDIFIDKTMNFINGNQVRKPAIQTKNPQVCAQKLPEKTKAGLLKTAMVISFLLAISMLMILFFDGFSYDFFKNLFLTALFSIFGFFTFRKSQQLDMISKDYTRFLRELGHNTVIPIRDLASSVQKSEKDTIKELMYMMNKGYFKQARIVENDSLFLLDIPTFKLYKNQKNQMPNLSHEENKKIAQDTSTKTNKDKAEEIIKISSKEITSINLSISRIKNRSFLEKVIEIKKTIENITNIIKRYPEKAYVLDKFIEYYLPTTVKLIDAYTEYEIMESNDSKIKNSLAEIESSIEIINEAFEKIQLELMEDRTMDIKTDIDTMKILLNQEGYLEKDWSKDE